MSSSVASSSTLLRDLYRGQFERKEQHGSGRVVSACSGDITRRPADSDVSICVVARERDDELIEGTVASSAVPNLDIVSPRQRGGTCLTLRSLIIEVPSKGNRRGLKSSVVSVQGMRGTV